MYQTFVSYSHRFTAIFPGLFILAHLSNHLAGFWGVETHQIWLEALRSIYYQPLVEGILLLAILTQVVSGISKVRASGLRHEELFARLQIYSGLYLAFFLMAHSSAILIGRNLLGLDTNFYFGAFTLVTFPYVYFFVPYYCLGIISFFTHLGCVIRWSFIQQKGTRFANRLAYGVISLGAVIALMIILIFTGGLYEINLPDVYIDMYPTP